MALETVRFYTLDEDDDALSGVLVRVYDSTLTFITQQSSSMVGSDAIAEVTLEGDDPPETYTIRLYKAGVAFDGSLGDGSSTPQEIDIYSPPTAAPSGTNDFTLKGQTFELPTAIDPLLCRVSGYVRDYSRSEVVNYKIRIIPWDPGSDTPAAIRVDEGHIVTAKSTTISSDENGYVQFDLYRNSDYLVRLEDSPDTPRMVHVPDRASIVIGDVLYPVVRSVSYGSNPVTVPEGSSTTISVVITSSDYRTLTPQSLVWTSDDTSIANVSIDGDDITISGVSTGTVDINASRSEDSFTTYPEEPQVCQPLTVNVV